MGVPVGLLEYRNFETTAVHHAQFRPNHLQPHHDDICPHTVLYTHTYNILHDPSV
jgi:hypothetical protein